MVNPYKWGRICIFMSGTRQQLVLEEKDGCQTDLEAKRSAPDNSCIWRGPSRRRFPLHRWIRSITCAPCTPINELHVRAVSCSARSHRSGEAGSDSGLGGGSFIIRDILVVDLINEVIHSHFSARVLMSRTGHKIYCPVSARDRVREDKCLTRPHSC